MATAIYSTTHQSGVDINHVFYLDTAALEYPQPPFLPGELGWGTDGSEWVYATASITIAPGSAVIFSAVPGSWSVALTGGASIASANVLTGQLVGVVGGNNGSMAVGAPSGTQVAAYFWVQRAGNIPNLKLGVTGNKNLQLYSSATVAGGLSSVAGGVGTTFQVNGIVFSQANGSTVGPNTAIANFPVVGSAA